MLAENMPALLDGLAVIAATALLIAFGCCAMLIWEDWQRDLHARVEDDQAEQPARPYDHETDDLDLEAI